MIRREENYFIKVELENEGTLIHPNEEWIGNYYTNHDTLHNLMCHISGYWHDSERELIFDNKYYCAVHKYVYNTRRWEY